MKRIIIASAVLVVLAVSAWFLFFRSSKFEVSKNPEFAKYISGYSSGVISKKSAIRVKLVSSFASQFKTTEEVDPDVFDFSPSIKGKVIWADPQTLEFKPEADLPSGVTFQAVLHLDKLTKMPNELETFKFVFQTSRQNFEAMIDKIVTTDKKDYSKQKAIGTIRTADVVTLDELKKMIEAKQGSQQLTVDVKQGATDQEFTFEINDISRTASASTVSINCNGNAIGVDRTDKLQVDVPAVNDFSYLFYRTVQAPEQYLLLQFSDPIKEDQDLDGLISMTNQSGLQFTIEDNTIKVFPANRFEGNYNVNINRGILNSQGTKLTKERAFPVSFEMQKPAVRMVNKGVILPSGDKELVYPFEAVNLKAVDVNVLKIYENNVLQFLQVNDLQGDYELHRVGLPVMTKTIRLDQSGIVDFNKWTRFSIDLKDLIKADPGAIYRITISFKQEYSAYPCPGSGTTSKKDELTSTSKLGEESDDENNTNWTSGEDEGYYYEDYGDDYWANRDNPCHKAYYKQNRQIGQNIFVSNIGLIAKMGNDGQLKVIVTDLLTAKPIDDAKVDILNYQQQVLKTGETNGDGIADFEKLKDPYFVVVSANKQKGYLKLVDGSALSMSKFDISGSPINKGLKGFIYGERGVWRPGDSIYLTFILKEESLPLPENHPVIMELRNPNFQVVSRLVQTKNAMNFYTFHLKTDENAPTGSWEASVSVGGAKFIKGLRIETVKPNRLKINIDFKKDYLEKEDKASATLNAKWLHGAIAKNLTAKVDVLLSASSTSFKQYPGYVFDDKTRTLATEPISIFDGGLDEEGNARVNADIKLEQLAPGKLNATFMTKVFEDGGNFSTDQFSIPYYPYSTMVGLQVPKGNKSSSMIVTDTNHTASIVLVDTKGNLINKPHNIQFEIFKMEWRWWWEQAENASNYNASIYNQPLKKATVTAQGGKANWTFRVNYPDWGRYLIKATDLDNGHAASEVVYMDWPGWYSRNNENHPQGAAMLMLTTDKTKYNVGEEVKLTVPTSENSRMLVSLENGTKVLKTYMVAGEKGQTQFTFKATPDMSPNIYVNVTLLQPHAQTVNDLPIRLYGVAPIMIEDPETHLEPIISMPNELEAEKTISLTVSEKNKREMSYTIAIVDEGLLDLTRFKTPDPWQTFYAREALGVKTWDLYDWVIGASSGELARLLSIGGDQGINKKAGQKANRFPPMVKFMGPFHLKGGSQTHKIEMPRYVGSVRTMVIAGSARSYGFAEKTTAVKKPLMVLATLPRVLGPGEKVKLPLSVFAMDKNIRSANVKVKISDLLRVVGSAEKTVSFKTTGEENIDFDLDVLPKIGHAKVEVIVTSGNQKATDVIDIEVRNPNPRVTQVISKVLEAGETWNTDYKTVGITGTNHGVLEVSSIPPVNLDKRLKYLIAYPHGCIEQTTSSVFPQLYLGDIVDLSADKKADIEQNVKLGIQRLATFQLFNGGMGYWQNSTDADEWGTSYAGHFLIEAEKKGFTVSSDMLRRWKKYQQTRAGAWTDNGKYSQLIQAYRLYTLALSGSADKGAMNRLKECKLNDDAKWRLAAAYVLAGKQDIANTLTANLSTVVAPYSEYWWTYGSAVRDEAMILETQLLLNKKKESFELLKRISEQLGKDEWMSTQTTAYALIAVSKYLVQNMTSSSLKFSYKLNANADVAKNYHKTIGQETLAVDNGKGGKLQVKNQSTGIIYARLILDGIPETDQSEESMNNLRVNVVYKSTSGSVVNPSELSQGTDFMAEVTVSNPGTKGNLEQLALTQIFPSGWEIINTRMADVEKLGNSAVPTYQDIRDDRVYSYFNLKPNESKTFRLMLNASYAGKFYLPGAYVEAMYDATINARLKGEWIEIARKEK
jgi:alpha-2-macroglobulin